VRTRHATMPVLAAAVASAITGCAGSSPASSPTASASSSFARAAAASSASPGGGAVVQAMSGRTTQAPWDRPNDQERLVKAAGLVLRPTETLEVHYHSHLNVVVEGKAVPIAADLGINAAADRSRPEHGAQGIAPLHTHDSSGVLHVEAPKADRFTLGQAFTLWDVALGKGRIGGYVDGQKRRHVSVFVDGKPYAGDPRQIALKDHLDIDIVVASGVAKPTAPKPYDWTTF
jgi:hypothetical protein